MQERFLHRVWQLSLFDKAGLKTTAGEKVEVLQPGLLNEHAGPDFSGARLRIGELEWHGDVEIHLKSSDWLAHQHQHDKAYDRVILHVVDEEQPQSLQRTDGSPIPTLSLSGRIWPQAYAHYTRLIESLDPIPCQNFADSLNELSRQAMLSRCLLERLQRKAKEVEQQLQQNAGSWEETAWQRLVQHMGFKVNEAGFMELARRLPWKLFIKLKNLPVQREALLFGLAGLLPSASDDVWLKQLIKEWNFLQHKHRLADQVLSPVVWKMARLRPANFPTLRLAQLATLAGLGNHLFRQLLEEKDAEKLIAMLRKAPTAYWENHYHFGKTSRKGIHRMGRSSAISLLINVVAPLRVAYGRLTDQPSFTDSALDLLQQLPAEDNQLTRKAEAAGFQLEKASDSQAAIELVNFYCLQKRCLDCSLGLKLLQRAAQ